MKRFVDVDYVKKRIGAIEKNVDAEKIAPHIQTAQEVDISAAMCEEYYDDFFIRFNDNTLSANEIILLDKFIKPALAFFTYYYALPGLSIKVTNKSASKEDSEFSNPADLNDLKYLRANDAMIVANSYAEKLRKELTKNSSKYPERQGCGCGTQGVGFRSSVWLG